MDNKDNTYYIGQLAKLLGLSQRAIRYYEELGLIKPSRTDGRFRVYSERDADLIRMIIRFKDLGMTLEDIRMLVTPHGDMSSDSLRLLREQLKARRAEFESKIDRYNEGIIQIDRVLHILSNCATCGRPSERAVCQECLKQHGDEISPLVSSLINDDLADE